MSGNKGNDATNDGVEGAQAALKEHIRRTLKKKGGEYTQAYEDAIDDAKQDYGASNEEEALSSDWDMNQRKKDFMGNPRRKLLSKYMDRITFHTTTTPNLATHVYNKKNSNTQHNLKQIARYLIGILGPTAAAALVYQLTKRTRDVDGGSPQTDSSSSLHESTSSPSQSLSDDNSEPIVSGENADHSDPNSQSLTHRESGGEPADPQAQQKNVDSEIKITNSEQAQQQNDQDKGGNQKPSSSTSASEEKITKLEQTIEKIQTEHNTIKDMLKTQSLQIKQLLELMQKSQEETPSSVEDASGRASIR